VPRKSSSRTCSRITFWNSPQRSTVGTPMNRFSMVHLQPRTKWRSPMQYAQLLKMAFGFSASLHQKKC